jgi:hypothetical protein
MIIPTQRPLPDNKQHSQDGDIWTHIPSKRKATDLHLDRAATGIGSRLKYFTDFSLFQE